MDESVTGRGIDLTKVTRVTIVGHQAGVLGEHFADSWHAYLQDDGRSLTLFADGTGKSAMAAHHDGLAKSLAEHEALARAYRRCGGAE